MPLPHQSDFVINKIDLNARRVNAISDTPSGTGETDDSKFSNLINNPSAQIQAQHVVKPQQEVQKVQAPSPMEAAEQVDRQQRDREGHSVKSLEDLTTESKETLQKMIDAKKTLEANPNVQFSKEDVLKGTRSLTHIDESLRIALSKVGGDKHITAAATQPINDLSTPVHKFLSFLSNSQYQFEHLNDQLDYINSTGSSLSLSNMLALQMKVGIITNQVDFFTGLLAKSLEATKTIMNIQV
jgi:hypothetical protein